jgi:hypothetical protein
MRRTLLSSALLEPLTLRELVWCFVFGLAIATLLISCENH